MRGAILTAFLAAGLVGMATLGCNRRDGTAPQQSPQAQSSAADQIDAKAFKPFAERFTEALNRRLPEEQAAQKAKAADDDTAEDEKFTLDSVDVVKTDSLVHPTQAVVIIRWASGYESKRNHFMRHDFAQLRVTFSREAGKWVVVEAKRKLESAAVVPPERPEDSHERIGQEHETNIDFIRAACARANGETK